jgi:hypothetical protein
MRAAGVIAYLTKPLDLTELGQLLDTAAADHDHHPGPAPGTTPAPPPAPPPAPAPGACQEPVKEPDEP